jgi:hypothetical protein
MIVSVHTIIDYTMDNDNHWQKTRTTTSIAVIAIVAIVALLGVVVGTVAVTILYNKQKPLNQHFLHA